LERERWRRQQELMYNRYPAMGGPSTDLTLDHDLTSILNERPTPASGRNMVSALRDHSRAPSTSQPQTASVGTSEGSLLGSELMNRLMAQKDRGVLTVTAAEGTSTEVTGAGAPQPVPNTSPVAALELMSAIVTGRKEQTEPPAESQPSPVIPSSSNAEPKQP
jgi:hypothetical protein